MPQFSSGHNNTALTASLLESWNEDGFLILRNFFEPTVVAQINRLVDHLWSSRTADSNKLIIDTYLNSPQCKRVPFRSVTKEVRESPYKLNDLYLEYDEVRHIVLHAELTRIISLLLQGTPLVINTLNFEFGSQQDDHVDTFYMPPKKSNCMLATWIALEPITADSGPIRYYPKSHKIPPYLFSNGKTNAIASELPSFNNYMQRELEERNIEAKTFTAESGDIFIWHAQLLHGGTPIMTPSKTRKSLVTHYFRKAEYRHLFWRLKKVHRNAYYYKRPHQS